MKDFLKILAGCLVLSLLLAAIYAAHDKAVPKATPQSSDEQQRREAERNGDLPPRRNRERDFAPSVGVDETCPKQANGVDAEKPLLYARICGWHDDPKGGLCIYMKAEGDKKVYSFFWIGDGVNGTAIVLPKWFTTGDARFLQTDKLEAAWKDRTSGVFRYEYDPATLNELFPGKNASP